MATYGYPALLQFVRMLIDCRSGATALFATGIRNDDCEPRKHERAHEQDPPQQPFGDDATHETCDTDGH